MKIKEGFELRDVCGENVLVAYGEQHIDFSKIISLNESAAFLWRTVEGKEFTADDMVQCLCQEYDVDTATARADVQDMLLQWKEQGLIVGVL